MKKTIALMLAAILLGGSFTGCRQLKKESEGSQLSVVMITTTSAADDGRAAGGAAGDATFEEEVTKPARKTEETKPAKPSKPLSSKPTATADGKINHGHTVPKNREEERLIRKTSDVILTEADAYKFLTESITLQSGDLHFELTETSDKDPGAFMWYKFTVYKGDIKVMNAEFDVVCFTDGTLCEGRADFTECSFYDAGDILDSKTALAKYREKTGDERSMYLAEKCYMYTGRYQERCPVAYVYRYKKGRIIVNAHTGEMIGMYKDQID